MVGETMNKEQEDFEKQFPSLKGKEDIEDDKYLWNDEKTIFFSKEIIQENCIDKKEFERLIDKIIGRNDVRAIELKKELRK